METKQTTISAIDFEQLASELLGGGNMLRFRAHGRSMHPFIKDGDILTISPIEPSSLKHGDIAFYRRANEKLAAHRILSQKRIAEKNVFLIRGDGDIRAPEQIPADSIMGIVIKAEHNGTEIELNSFRKRATANIWSKTQSVRWFIYRVKRRLTPDR